MVVFTIQIVTHWCCGGPNQRASKLLVSFGRMNRQIIICLILVATRIRTKTIHKKGYSIHSYLCHFDNLSLEDLHQLSINSHSSLMNSIQPEIFLVVVQY
jgi:hypothetical protein